MQFLQLKISISILPTIISRCQVIELKPDNKEVLKEKLIAKGYEEEKA